MNNNKVNIILYYNISKIKIKYMIKFEVLAIPCYSKAL